MFTVEAGVVVVLQGFEIGLIPFVASSFLSLVIIVLPVLLKKWFFVRRRLKGSEITAEYLPPLGLSPAEISYLFNGEMHQRVVAATIINLIKRGILSAKKVEGKKRIFVGPRVDNSLKQHEKMLVVQADSENGISGDDLLNMPIVSGTKDTGGPGIDKALAMSQSIKNNLVELGYIRDNSTRQIIYRSTKLSAFLVLTLVWLPLAIAVFLSTVSKGSTTFADVGNFLVLSGIISVIFLVPMYIVSALLNIIRGRLIGREWLITRKFTRLWLQVIGFRQYVQLAEQNKLVYRTVKLEKSSKSEILPYAVALGFVKNWRNIVS